MDDLQQTKDFILQALSVGVFSWLVYELRQIRTEELKPIRESIESLNIKIAVIIRDVDNHEHRLNKLEDK
jgi:hypothetical protein